MAIYFSSDFHFNHWNVCFKYCDRPFSTLQEMHEAIIERHNAIVTDADTVYNLGDVAMNPNVVERFISRLRGRQILISGNHDPCHARYSVAKQEKFKQRYLEAGFAEIYNELTIDIQGTPFILNHFPYDNEDPRFAPYLPKDSGGWLLCGHVHEKWKLKNKMINCGVDVWSFTPVSEQDIMKVVKSV